MISLFRHISCLAKEAYASWAIHVVLSSVTREDFFGISPFLLNPIPPSYIEQLPDIPKTAYHSFAWKRGAFYKDLGKLLPRVEFDVDVTVTRYVMVSPSIGGCIAILVHKRSTSNFFVEQSIGYYHLQVIKSNSFGQKSHYLVAQEDHM